MVSRPGGSIKKPKFTETWIVSILKQADASASVKDICRQAGISSARPARTPLLRLRPNQRPSSPTSRNAASHRVGPPSRIL
jgi:putative transposase